MNKSQDKCSNCGSTKSKTFWDYPDETILCDKCEKTISSNWEKEHNKQKKIKLIKITEDYNSNRSTEESISDWYNHGLELMETGNYEEAIERFNNVIKLVPDSLDAWFKKGFSYALLGKNQEAIKCFDKAIKICPEAPGPLASKGSCLMNLASPNDTEKYMLDAIKCFDKAIKNIQDGNTTWDNKKQATIWNNKGGAYYILKNYNQALECFNKTIELDPNIYLGENKTIFEKINKNLNNFSILYNKGNAFLSSGEYSKAIECYDKALKIDSSKVNALNNKGTAWDYLGEYDKAIECYNQVLSKDPKNSVALTNKADTLKSLKKYANIGLSFKQFKEYFLQLAPIQGDNNQDILNKIEQKAKANPNAFEEWFKKFSRIKNHYETSSEDRQEIIKKAKIENPNIMVAGYKSHENSAYSKLSKRNGIAKSPYLCENQIIAIQKFLDK